MTNIAYIRVSKADPDRNPQIKALEKYDIQKWFEEEKSVNEKSHPVLDEMIHSVNEGDTVYVHDFSRIAKTAKNNYQKS